MPMCHTKSNGIYICQQKFANELIYTKRLVELYRRNVIWHGIVT